MAPTVFIESNSKYDKLNDCGVQTSIQKYRYLKKYDKLF